MHQPFVTVCPTKLFKIHVHLREIANLAKVGTVVQFFDPHSVINM